MIKARDAGKAIGEALRLVNWYWCMEALVRMPAMFFTFAEYVPDGERMYLRGDVVKIGANKYLLQGDGRIDPSKPPPENSLCKLFRDSGRYDPDGTPRSWVREEYCLKDFARYWTDDNPQKTGWYRVKAERVDDATPPPNSVSWELIQD